MYKQVSLSVIVPSLNEESNLDEAVRNMMDALNITCTDWEIIVLDNASDTARSYFCLSPLPH